MNLYRKYAGLLKNARSQGKKRWCLNKMRKYAHLKDVDVDTAPKFVTGQLVKIGNVPTVRYRGVKGTVIGPADKGSWTIQVPRRKSPLIVHEDDLMVA